MNEDQIDFKAIQKTIRNVFVQEQRAMPAFMVVSRVKTHLPPGTPENNKRAIYKMLFAMERNNLLVVETQVDTRTGKQVALYKLES